jgi:hypothetical protein
MPLSTLVTHRFCLKAVRSVSLWPWPPGQKCRETNIETEELATRVLVWKRLYIGINQSINQSLFPVTPVWSTGHPPHTATELCPSLPPSRRSSSDLQLCPPFELISSRCYSVVPSSWTLCVFHPRAVRFTSAWGFRNVCPNRLHVLRLISSSAGTWAVLHTSWLLTASWPSDLKNPA